MKENRLSCDLPLVVDPSVQITFIAIGLLGSVGVMWFARSEGVPFLLVFGLLFLAIALYYAGQLAARLHIALEGITVTLFGMTLRRVPAGAIRNIVAVRKYNNKGNHHDVMALCANSLEELAELGNRHTPKLLKSSMDRWYGETAAKYLWRRAESFRGEFNLHSNIFWLDWSPERLKLLLEMYPHAQWLDGTEKKLFDAQLTQ